MCRHPSTYYRRQPTLQLATCSRSTTWCAACNFISSCIVYLCVRVCVCVRPGHICRCVIAMRHPYQHSGMNEHVGQASCLPYCQPGNYVEVQAAPAQHDGSQKGTHSSNCRPWEQRSPQNRGPSDSVSSPSLKQSCGEL